jgi:uroporphyrinogen-III decarboxylase
MKSRDRVLAAFNHEEADRVPLWCGSSAEFWEKAKRELKLDDEALRVRMGDDFRRVFSRYAGPPLKGGAGACSRTVFGIDRHGMGYGQPMNHPLADASLKEVHDYPWPDPSVIDVSEVRHEAEASRGEYAILGGEWSPFWHDAIDLMGMENMFIKMHEEPQVVHAVLKHVVDYYVETNRKLFNAAAPAIDIFFIGNDLGSQTGPLIGVRLFRELILPHLRRLIQMGHDYRLKVQMHCCGGFEPLIPSLIEAELDALHAIQPCCNGMDLHHLKSSFGRKMVFNGCVDSQHVLIEGTVDFVKQQTREVLSIMATGGGYIAGASHDSILEETPVENVLAMFDAAKAWRCDR